MNLSQQLSNQVHDIYFGKNWTATNFKETLQDVTLEQALTSVYDLNSIAALVHHINYYITLQLRVLNGGPLEGSDKVSFLHPKFETEEEWNNYLKGIMEQALVFSEILAKFPNDQMEEAFGGSKYGSYYKNINGMIEHVYYHFGQIVIIKKIIHSKMSVITGKIEEDV